MISISQRFRILLLSKTRGKEGAVVSGGKDRSEYIVLFYLLICSFNLVSISRYPFVPFLSLTNVWAEKIFIDSLGKSVDYTLLFNNCILRRFRLCTIHLNRFIDGTSDIDQI